MSITVLQVSKYLNIPIICFSQEKPTRFYRRVLKMFSLTKVTRDILSKKNHTSKINKIHKNFLTISSLHV